MKAMMIQAAILAGIYYGVKNQQVRAAVLGVAGGLVASQVPYLNGKDAKGVTL